MRVSEYVIPDDSGILAVVDANRYRPFIGAAWTLDQILAHSGSRCGIIASSCGRPAAKAIGESQPP